MDTPAIFRTQDHTISIIEREREFDLSHSASVQFWVIRYNGMRIGSAYTVMECRSKIRRMVDAGEIV